MAFQTEMKPARKHMSRVAPKTPTGIFFCAMKEVMRAEILALALKSVRMRQSYDFGMLPAWGKSCPRCGRTASPKNG